MTQIERRCRHCGAVFQTDNIRRMYCSTACRRHWQDSRRLGERAEARSTRRRWKRMRMEDHLSRHDFFDSTVEEMLAGILLDPLPVGVG